MSILKRLLRWFQYPLDWFYYIRRALLTGLTFFAIRFFGLEDTWQEVWRGSKFSKRDALTFDESSDLDTLLAEAKYSLATAEKRRASVVDKYKTLLTLGSILLATIGLIFPKWFVIQEVAERGIFVAVLIVLLIAVILLLVFLDIGREKVVSIDQSDAVLNGPELKRRLINSYVECKHAVDGRTDFLIDVYQTARFFLSSALALVVILFSIHVLRGSTEYARRSFPIDRPHSIAAVFSEFSSDCRSLAAFASSSGIELCPDLRDGRFFALVFLGSHDVETDCHLGPVHLSLLPGDAVSLCGQLGHGLASDLLYSEPNSFSLRRGKVDSRFAGEAVLLRF